MYVLACDIDQSTCSKLCSGPTDHPDRCKRVPTLLWNPVRSSHIVGNDSSFFSLQLNARSPGGLAKPCESACLPRGGNFRNCLRARLREVRGGRLCQIFVKDSNHIEHL